MNQFTISGSFTDYYQITMGQAYFLEGMKEDLSCFDYFFRKLPFGGGFVVFAGLQDILEVISELRFTDEDLEFLKKQKLDPEFLKYLKNFRFRGDIYSSTEGDLVFPTRPILRVEASIIEAQLIETVLLNHLNFMSLIATKAARMRLVAGKRVLSDFGLRRAMDKGGISASKAAILGGFDSTSNVYSSLLYGLEASGTMAHSYIQSHENEYSAFRSYANAHPNDSIFLVDTYNTLNSGVPNAIAVAKEMEAEGKRLKAIRLDSGDLAYLSKKARKLLDDNGLSYVKIAASNQLDEYLIKSLIEQDAPIDIFGVGTSLVTGQPDAALDGVYKLSMFGGKASIKLSENPAKTTLPGIKQTFRLTATDGNFYGGDIVSLENEEPSEYMYHPFEREKHLNIAKFGKEKLLHKVMDKGEIIIGKKSPAEIKEHVRSRLASLPDEFKRFDFPHIYKIGLSNDLYSLRESMIKKYRKIEIQ